MNLFDNPAQEIHTTEPGDGSFAHTLVAAESAGYKVIHRNAGILTGVDLVGMPRFTKNGHKVYHNDLLKELWENPKTLVYFYDVKNATPKVRDMIQHMVETHTMPKGEKLPEATQIIAVTI